MKRYQAWRRRQPSRTRYALVPAGSRIVASGLRSQGRVVELRNTLAWFAVALVVVTVAAGCGSAHTVHVTVVKYRAVPACAGDAAMSRCITELGDGLAAANHAPQVRTHARCVHARDGYACSAELVGPTGPVCEALTVVRTRSGIPIVMDNEPVEQDVCDAALGKQ